MEIRKVQATGGSSYIVSLPKNWVLKSGISKNDSVGLTVRRDGSLLITPSVSSRPPERIKEIDLSSVSSAEYLFRLLIGTYVAGFNTIIIKSNGRMPSFAKTAVREFIQSSVGQEISEETETSITIRDLLNPAEMPFDSIISRMYVIIEGMLSDAVFSLKNRDRTLSEDVLSGKHEIDKLYWLMSRQYSLILADSFLSGEMNIDAASGVHYLMAAGTLQKTAYQAVGIMENCLILMSLPLEKKILDNINAGAESVSLLLKAAVRSFTGRDMRAAAETGKEAEKFRKECERESRELFNSGKTGILPIGYICEHFRRISEYASAVCETAVNVSLISS